MTGNQREALLRVADQLCAQLGRADADQSFPDDRSVLIGCDSGGIWSTLDNEDELLVATVRRRLGTMVAAVGAARLEGVPLTAVCTALDGAELVMRGELVSGNVARLLEMMPSFVFLVTLPVVEHDEALDLSQRTQALVEGALGSFGE